MSFLFPKQAAPVMPPIPPVPPAPAVDAPSTRVEDDLRKDIKRRKGRPSTIATGGGLTTEPEVATVSLLGSAQQKEY